MPSSWPAAPALILFLMLAIACSCRPAAVDGPPPATSPSPAAPPEDDEAVPGGPIDLSDFDFDVDAPDQRGPPPTLVGVDGVRPSTAQALAPYLEVKRAKLAAVRPDGGQLVVLTRHGEATQLHAVDGPGEAPRPLTEGRDGVQQAAFVPGNPRQLVFRRDRDGDEVHQLYTLELEGGAVSRISDGVHRHGQFRILAGKPLTLGLTANMRSDEHADLITMKAPDFAPHLEHELSGSQVLIGKAGPGGGYLIRQVWSTERSRIARVRVGAEPEPLPDAQTPEGTYVDARIETSSADGSTRLWLSADFGGEWVGLYAVGPDGGLQRISHADAWDVEGFATLGGGEVAYTLNEDGYSRLYVLDIQTRQPHQIELPDGVISGLRRLGPRSLIFTLVTPTQPADVFSVDLEAGEVTRWTQSEPPGADADRVSPSMLRVPTGDDLEIPTLVYPAKATDSDATSPVLLWMHGGPEEQSRPEFNPIIQYFAEHGITVLVPNIRGSDGYGRTWRRRDDGVKRGAAIEDVGALLDWIALQPELDPQRVGIFGGSYGGYIVLAALTTYPDRFAAGCDLVGISHIPGFLENTAPYRRALRREEYGDERDAEVRAVLEDLSPLNFAHQISAPLFVAHGANDPRVPVAEARQIFDAVRVAGADPWLMVANDEGHSMKKRDNRDLFYGLMVDFFTQHLLEVADAAQIEP